MSGMPNADSVCGWVALDGVRLDSLAEGLVVTDVTEATSLAVETEPRAGLDGLWLTRLRREKLTVRVGFRVRQVNRRRRAQALSLAAAWARGGVLTWSDRPGQRLRVRCTAWPAWSALRWNESLWAEFTAFGTPWWESGTPDTLALSHTGGETVGSLAVSGQAETEVDVRLTAGSGGLDAVTLTVGGDTVAFTGLGMAAGEALVFGADAEGRRGWRIEGTDGSAHSAFACRSAGSADSLRAAPGSVTVRLCGDACEALLTARGRFL